MLALENLKIPFVRDILEPIPPFSFNIVESLIIILSVCKQGFSGERVTPSIFSPFTFESEYFLSLWNLLLFKYLSTYEGTKSN